MKLKFKNTDLENLYSKPEEELGKQKFSRAIINNYRKSIDMLKYADSLRDIAKLRGLNLEKLKDRKYTGCYSIRVNNQFRLIFKMKGGGGIEVLVLELSKHYE